MKTVFLDYYNRLHPWSGKGRKIHVKTAFAITLCDRLLDAGIDVTRLNRDLVFVVNYSGTIVTEIIRIIGNVEHSNIGSSLSDFRPIFKCTGFRLDMRHERHFLPIGSDGPFATLYNHYKDKQVK